MSKGWAFEWIAALDPATAQSYFFHAEQHELIFRKANAYAEQIEENLTDDDDDENELAADETENETDEWCHSFRNFIKE